MTHCSLREDGPGISLTVPKEEEVIPTLSLHSGNTSVMANFSTDDIKPVSSFSEIGVNWSYKQVVGGGEQDRPIVYAVDGSVVKFSKK